MFGATALMALHNVAVLVLGVATSSKAFSRGVRMTSFSFAFEECLLGFPRTIDIPQVGLTLAVSFVASLLVKAKVPSEGPCRSSGVSPPHSFVSSIQQVDVF